MAKKKKIIEETIKKNIQKPIGEISEEAYITFSTYVNSKRHTAGLKSGMKTSYLRLIWAAMQYPKGKEIPTSTLIASVSTWHGHGTDGLIPLNSALVRSGVFSGTGFFGSKGIDSVDSECASPRYTKNMLSPLYNEVLGDLIKEVPMVPSMVGPLEPEYIPLPLPLSLILKTPVSGLGVGMRSDYPTFSPQSLYSAYINNNPQLLEPNIDILMDKSNSELAKLWTTGKGRVIYAYKISRSLSQDGKTEGILFEGSSEIFAPNIKKFRKLEEEGKIYIEDLTDLSGQKLFVGKVPGARGITIDEIEALSRKVCYSSETYTINVTTDNTAFRIPLFDWIDITYKNYINLLVQTNIKRIEKVEFDLAVQEALPLVSNYVLNVNPKATDKEIITSLGIPVEIVDSVMSKPISYLRQNKDTSARVNALKSKLKELKSFNPVQFTETIIAKL